MNKSQAERPVLVAFDTKHLDYATAADQFSAEAVVIARLRDSSGRAERMHETSRFVREGGRWFYIDGEMPQAA